MPLPREQEQMIVNPETLQGAELGVLYKSSLEGILHHCMPKHGIRDTEGYNYMSYGAMPPSERAQAIADMYTLAAVLTGMDNVDAIRATAGQCREEELKSPYRFTEGYVGPFKMEPVKRIILPGSQETATYLRFTPQGMSAFIYDYSIDSVNDEHTLQQLLYAQALWQTMHDLGLPVGDPYLTQKQVTKIQERIAEIDSWQ